MPREGPVPGGGTIRVADRARLEQLRTVETPSAEAEAPVGLRGDLSRRSSGSIIPKSPARSSQHGGNTGRGTKSGGISGFERPGTSGLSVSESPHTSRAGGGAAGHKAPTNPEERRQAKLQSKFDKEELRRERDRKAIAERIHQKQEVREERFQRLLEEVTGEDNLAYTVGIEIRQRDVHQENRRRELHSAWETKVYQPLAAQAFDRINRAELQRASGAKSVDFHLPSEHPGSFRLVASVVEDPARKSVIDNARENAFHQTAVHEVARSAQAFVPAAPVQQYAPVSTAGLYEDGETWPEAVPYVHEDIAAEAYVHIEPANVPYVAAAPVAPVAAPVQQYAPVQQAAPAYYNPAAYAYAPVAPVKAGCFNWKGVAVECRY